MKEPKKMTPEQISKIKELYGQGLTAYKIAKVMSIPPGVAKYHIDRIGKAPSIAPNDSLTISMLRQEIERLKQKNQLLLEIISDSLKA